MKGKFWLFTIILCLGFFGIEYLWLSGTATKIYGFEINYGWAAFWGQLFYIIISLKKMGPTEIGAILIFGKPIQEVGPGLIFVPRGICSVEKEKATVIEEQYPDEPDKVWKGDSDKMPAGAGFVQPLRITHKGGTEDEVKSDPLHKRMTTEVSIFVRCRIKKGKYIPFLQTIGDSIEARRQIRDTIVATARKEFAKRTPATTLATWKKIDNVLKTNVEKLVEAWGLEVLDVRLEDVDLGKTVNTSLRDIPNSIMQKEVTVTKADGKEYEITHEGMGVAKAREVLLEAESIGYQKIAKALGITDGSFIMGMETAKQALEKSKYSIISGSDGMKDILSLASAIQSILPKIKKEAESENSASITKKTN